MSYQGFSGTGAPDGSFERRVYFNATWTFTSGDWHGTCDQQSYEWSASGGFVNTTSHKVYSAASPPHWPLFDTTAPPATGSAVKTWYLDGCAIESIDFQVYAGTDTEAVPVNGQTQTVPTFVATDTNDGSPNDFRSEWRQDTGLVLDWQWSQSHTRHEGRVTDMG